MIWKDKSKLFAAEEPLDVESIKKRMKTKGDVLKY